MHVENTVTIKRPIEEVFEYVSTPENDPTWVSASLRHERTSPDAPHVGMTTEEDVKFLGQQATYTWEVTEYDPPTVIAYRATSGPLPGAAIRLRLEPVEGGTRLRHAIDLEPRGIYYKAIAPLIPWATKRLIDSLDSTLKNLLEGKTAMPGSAASGMTGSVAAGVSLAGFGALLVLLRRHNRWARR